jgi:putative flippase GtrA
MPNFKRFAIYLAVGAAGTACQYVILVALVQAGLARPVLASSVGACVGAVVNYSLNYRITFASQAGIVRTASRFAAIACAGAGLNAALMHLMTVRFNFNYLVAQLASTAPVLLFMYSANVLWTFRAQRAAPN